MSSRLASGNIGSRSRVFCDKIGIRGQSQRTMGATTLIQAEQFAEMTFGENEKYELVEGALICVPSGTPRHGMIRDLLGDLVKLPHFRCDRPNARSLHFPWRPGRTDESG